MGNSKVTWHDVDHHWLPVLFEEVFFILVACASWERENPTDIGNRNPLPSASAVDAERSFSSSSLVVRAWHCLVMDVWMDGCKEDPLKTMTLLLQLQPLNSQGNMSLSCQTNLATGRLECPISSPVPAMPFHPFHDDNDAMTLEGILSCPLPLSFSNSKRRKDDEGAPCFCQGRVLSTSALAERSCRCVICPRAEKSELSVTTTIMAFSWQCNHPIVENCWGWDCHGNCLEEEEEAVVLVPPTLFIPGDDDDDDDEKVSSAPPSPSSLEAADPGTLSRPSWQPHRLEVPTYSMYPSPPSPSPVDDSNSNSNAPTTVQAAQSASLLWMLGFLVATQNSTNIWTSPEVGGTSVLWQYY